jgi:hypothetical protein
VAKRWNDKAACAAAGVLSLSLIADEDLARLASEAGALGPCSAHDGRTERDRWIDLCGNLAGFLIAWANTERRDELRERNASFATALERMVEAVDSFERESGGRLPSMNESLSGWLDEFPHAAGWWRCLPDDGSLAVRVRGREAAQREWERHPSGVDNPWDVRSIPEVRLQDVLEWFRELVVDESRTKSDQIQFQGPSDHRWLRTPSGQLPRTNSAAASWWAIRALRDRLPDGERFNELAAHCVGRLVLAWCDLTGEPPPKSDETDEQGRDVLQGINAKTIGQMVRDLARAGHP